MCMFCLTDAFSRQGADVDGLLVSLKLNPEGDLGEWLVKHGHASFPSANNSLSPPPHLAGRSSPGRSSPMSGHSSPLIDHTATLVDRTSSSVDRTLPLIDHSSQPGNDSSLQFHSPLPSHLVMEECGASQSIDDGPTCESGEQEICSNKF